MTARRRGLPTGIQRKHSRACPAFTDRKARCRDLAGCSYQAQAGPRHARRTVTFAELQDAVTWRAEQQLRHGWQRGRRVPTLEEAIATWQDACCAGEVLSRRGKPHKRATIDRYVTDLRAHVAPSLGDRRLDEIRRGDVKAVVARMLAEGRAATSTHNALVALQSLYRWALDLDLVRTTPAAGVLVTGVSQSRRTRLVTVEEAEALIAALEERDRPLWATAFHAGLRRGELQALRWSDVDLGRRLVHVRRAFDQRTGVMGDTKSDAGRRTVEVPWVLVELLAGHRAHTHGELVFARGSLAGTCRRGTEALPFNDSTTGQRANAAWRAAGLDPVGLHELRHGFGSMWLAAGVPIEVISKRMGHSSIQVTTDVYLHLRPDAGEAAIAHVEAHLAERTGPASRHGRQVVDLAAQPGEGPPAARCSWCWARTRAT